MVIPDFYYEDNYYVGLYESIKLHAKARVNKGLKRRKYITVNLFGVSSDESLATVDQKVSLRLMIIGKQEQSTLQPEQ